MLSIYVCTALILIASLLLGRAMLILLRWNGPAWIAGATGLATLVVLAPLLVRLPGRATTAALIVAVLVIAAAVVIVRARAWPDSWLGASVVAITVALATIPFLVNDRVGVLGEGIYTNDHAAQLYWADWLQHGFGPQPSAVRFGYPVGPQAVVAIAADATGASLVTAFNGLLLAIPALTGLAALGALTAMPPLRRIAIASLAGLPYLAASFLAQTAFKETAMALFVLAFAIALASLRVAGWRGVLGAGLILAAASVFTFSIPGLAWFAIAVPLWLVLEGAAGESPVDWRGIGSAIAAHRMAVAAAVLLILGLAALAIGPAIDFVDKIGEVGESPGRLSSPVFPGEAFGIWPAGDFRLVRGDVSGSLLAATAGGLVAIYGAYILLRRRELALLAMLVSGAIVYLGARVLAEIHVEAKALAIIAPLVLLVGLRALLAPDRRDPSTAFRYACGAVVLVVATASTLLALRDAPVGYDDRQAGLEALAERADGEPVAFLGVDRFAGYYLRGTLARAPAGYVPEEIAARPEKVWQQGQAVDFDTLEPGKLDKFSYAITTTAGYASTPPANFEPVAQSSDYVLWQRRGETPRSRVLPGEGGEPGQMLDCGELRDRPGEATVLDGTTQMPYQAWDLPPLVEPAAGGQERAFAAPAEALGMLDLAGPGRYELSLQYHSQVPLAVAVDGDPVAELPPSLDGMYLDGAGRGAFWPAGEVQGAGPIEVTVRADEPTGLQDAIGAERRVWLGDLAATREDGVEKLPLARACGRYVDHFAFARNRR